MLQYIKKLRFLFLFLITLLFCIVTAIDAEIGLPMVANFFFALIFLSAILIISGNEKHFFAWILALVLVKLLDFILSFWLNPAWVMALRAFAAMIYFMMLSFFSFHLVRKDKSVNVTTLFGALSAYLFMGLSFAYLYAGFFILNPQSFSGFIPYIEARAVYFSFITLSTVGYGDVLAMNPIMQTMSWIEAFLGQAYMALFISRLVSRFVAAEMRG